MIQGYAIPLVKSDSEPVFSFLHLTQVLRVLFVVPLPCRAGYFFLLYFLGSRSYAVSFLIPVLSILHWLVHKPIVPFRRQHHFSSVHSLLLKVPYGHATLLATEICYNYRSIKYNALEPAHQRHRISLRRSPSSANNLSVGKYVIPVRQICLTALYRSNTSLFVRSFTPLCNMLLFCPLSIAARIYV